MEETVESNQSHATLATVDEPSNELSSKWLPVIRVKRFTTMDIANACAAAKAGTPQANIDHTQTQWQPIVNMKRLSAADILKATARNLAIAVRATKTNIKKERRKPQEES